MFGSFKMPILAILSWFKREYMRYFRLVAVLLLMLALLLLSSLMLSSFISCGSAYCAIYFAVRKSCCIGRLTEIIIANRLFSLCDTRPLCSPVVLNVFRFSDTVWIIFEIRLMWRIHDSSIHVWKQWIALKDSPSLDITEIAVEDVYERAGLACIAEKNLPAEISEAMKQPLKPTKWSAHIGSFHTSHHQYSSRYVLF